MTNSNVAAFAFLACFSQTCLSQIDVQYNDAVERQFKKQLNGVYEWNFLDDAYTGVQIEMGATPLSKQLFVQKIKVVGSTELINSIVRMESIRNRITGEVCEPITGQEDLCELMRKIDVSDIRYKLDKSSQEVGEKISKYSKTFFGVDRFPENPEFASDLKEFNDAVGEGINGVIEIGGALTKFGGKLGISQQDIKNIDKAVKTASAVNGMINGAIGASLGDPGGYLQVATSMASLAGIGGGSGPSTDAMILASLRRIEENQKKIIEKIDQIQQDISEFRAEIKRDSATISQQINQIRGFLVQNAKANLSHCGNFLDYLRLSDLDLRRNAYYSWDPDRNPNDIASYLPAKQIISEQDNLALMNTCRSALVQYFVGSNQQYQISKIYQIPETLFDERHIDDTQRLYQKKMRDHKLMLSVLNRALQKGFVPNGYPKTLEHYYFIGAALSPHFNSVEAIAVASNKVNRRDISFSIKNGISDEIQSYLFIDGILDDTRDFNAVITLAWQGSLEQNLDPVMVTRLLSATSVVRMGLAQESINNGIGSAGVIYEILNASNLRHYKISDKEYSALLKDTLTLINSNRILADNILRYSILRRLNEKGRKKTDSWYLNYNVSNDMKNSTPALRSYLGEWWTYSFIKGAKSGEEHWYITGAQKFNNEVANWDPSRFKEVQNRKDSTLNDRTPIPIPTPSQIDARIYRSSNQQEQLALRLLALNRLIGTIATYHPDTPAIKAYH